jgi:hypothetical protein
MDTVKLPSINWHPDSDIVATPELAKKLGLGRTAVDEGEESDSDEQAETRQLPHEMHSATGED